MCNERRGEQKSMNVMDENNSVYQFIFPLSEIINDFFDKIKTMTKGYGSLDYDFVGYLIILNNRIIL